MLSRPTGCLYLNIYISKRLINIPCKRFSEIVCLIIIGKMKFIISMILKKFLFCTCNSLKSSYFNRKSFNHRSNSPVFVCNINYNCNHLYPLHLKQLLGCNACRCRQRLEKNQLFSNRSQIVFENENDC